MKKNFILRVIQEVLISLFLIIFIYGGVILIIYDVTSIFTKPINKVYTKDGKYGFMAKGNFSKETLYTSNDYVSIDTITKVFIYEIQTEMAGGREIFPVEKSIYVARDQFGKVDLFATKYRNKNSWGLRRAQEVLLELVHKCDSFSFIVDTALYCQRDLPPEQSIKCPVNMIVYFKGTWKGLTSYRGGSTSPELELDPSRDYDAIIYGQP